MNIVNHGSCNSMNIDSNLKQKPLIRSFGLKGIYKNEFGVSAAQIKNDSGVRYIDLQTIPFPS